MNVLRLAAVASILALAAVAQAGLDDVKVVTDTSIDCSSMETIARDIWKDCKTDQDKAVATWYFVRRMMYHWPHIPTWDTLDLINSYGFGLCGYQSTAYCQIATAGGMKARTMHPTSHVIAEAFYDDAWHMFDCQVGWYALNRQGKVASVEELKADDTLVSKAVEENRASKPYFQCRDNPGSGTNYAKTAKVGRTPELPKRKLTINLRRGESITRNWSDEGKPWFQQQDNKGFTNPRHTCSGNGIDDNDPVNWTFWQPYVQGAVKRHYGNGRLVYEPDLANEALIGLAEGEGAAAKQKDGKGPNIHPAAAGKPASVIFTIDCPYIGTDAWIEGAAIRKNAGDVLAIHARRENAAWQEVWKADQTGQVKLDNISLKKFAWENHRYQVKFELSAEKDIADVGLENVKFVTVFMNNLYALPYFKPGKNTIKLTAADGADPAKNKLTLEYAWQEQSQDKTLSKTIDKLPFEAVVEVGGTEMPKMKSIRLSVSAAAKP